MRKLTRQARSLRIGDECMINCAFQRVMDIERPANGEADPYVWIHFGAGTIAKMRPWHTVTIRREVSNG